MNDIKIEMYNIQNTYLEGWYSITDLKRVIKTAERMNEVAREMAEESEPDKFKSMDETTSSPGDDWQSTPKG
jgi:hypothetical protein